MVGKVGKVDKVDKADNTLGCHNISDLRVISTAQAAGE